MLCVLVQSSSGGSSNSLSFTPSQSKLTGSMDCVYISCMYCSSAAPLHDSWSSWTFNGTQPSGYPGAGDSAAPLSTTRPVAFEALVFLLPQIGFERLWKG